MIINKIAKAVFDSFDDTDIVITILNHNGSYVSNGTKIFEQIFSEQQLLDNVYRKIDDGQEPLFSQIGDYFVAASSISCGYAVMLLPADTIGNIQQNFSFIEIILQQLSQTAGLIEQNQQLKDFSPAEKNIFEAPVFAAMN